MKNNTCQYNNNNNNNKYLLEESCKFCSYEVFKLIILLFPLKVFI